MFKRFSYYLNFVLIMFQTAVLLAYGIWFYGYFIRSSYNELLQKLKLSRNKIFSELNFMREKIGNISNRLIKDNLLKVSLFLKMKDQILEFIQRESMLQDGRYILVITGKNETISTVDLDFLLPFINKIQSKKTAIVFIQNKGLFFITKNEVFMRGKFLGYLCIIKDISKDKNLWKTIEDILPYTTIIWYDKNSKFAWDMINKKKIKNSNFILLKDFTISMKNLFSPRYIIFPLPIKNFQYLFILHYTFKLTNKILHITQLTFFSFIFVLLLTFFISYILAKRISLPINYLRKKCLLLSNKPTSEFIDTKKIKYLEFKDLGEAFNKVLSSFLEAQKKVQLWAEREIHKSEVKYQTLVEACPIGILTINKDGEISFYNKVALEIFGYSPDELKKMNFFSLFTEDGMDVIKSSFQNVPLETENPLEVKIVTTKGIKWVELYTTFIREENNFLVLVMDITQRKKIEEEKKILINIVEQLPEAVILTDKQGYILYTNPVFNTLFGYSSKDTKKMSITTIWNDRDLYEKVWDYVLKGNTWSGRTKDLRKDGLFLDTFSLVFPLKEKGEIKNVLVIKRDITQELKLERELARVQRLQAIGTLAGGIAHDFNNILTTLMGYIQMAISMIPYNEKPYSYLEKCLEGCFRAKDLISQLLTFSRSKEEEKREPILLSPIIKEAVKFFTASLPPNIFIDLDVKDPSPIINGNATQIYQILANLMTNSAYAMREKGGKLTISLNRVKLERGAWLVEKDVLLPGEYALLVVEDTGVGIKPEVLERVFEPFFTTKPKGEGTGMGLAVVYGIVKSYNGFIHIESEEGKGTKVYIYLPIYKINKDQ